MWLSAKFSSGISTIQSEWRDVKRAAYKGEYKEDSSEKKPYQPFVNPNSNQFSQKHQNQSPKKLDLNDIRKIKPDFIGKIGGKRDN